MTFTYKDITPEKRTEYRKQVCGPIFVFQTSYAEDEDRGIVFLSLGGQGNQPPERGEGPSYYNLIWKGCAIAFEAYHAIKRSDDGGSFFEFTITKVQVPTKSTKTLNDIKDAIIAGAQCYWSGIWEETLLLNVSFSGIEFY
ncbi:hypothetical protein UNDYM_4183 [Undibacterium sp. YM2]|uniref:hypothetical protein n=1 Tax=Undibacterium sp. YM2 TaxID=2058625 RepID=UPI001331C477|nr:hypothetical protein [Undibacterium sp. YM2]BBB68436.1 hypothetical protein UNDYM_4183 [Undibacterium sp. YM2]